MIDLIGINHISKSEEELESKINELDPDKWDKIYYEGIDGWGKLDREVIINSILQPFSFFPTIITDFLRIHLNVGAIRRRLQNDWGAVRDIADKNDLEIENIDAPPFYKMRFRDKEKIALDWFSIIVYLASGNAWVLSLVFTLQLFVTFQMQVNLRNKYMANQVSEKLTAGLVLGDGHIPGLYYYLEERGIEIRKISTENTLQ